MVLMMVSGKEVVVSHACETISGFTLFLQILMEVFDGDLERGTSRCNTVVGLSIYIVVQLASR